MPVPDTIPASFLLPEIFDNPDGSWGPSPSNLPPQLSSIPYVPYDKSESIGQIADWNGYNESAFASQRAGYNRRGGKYGQRETDGFAAEDESAFSLVDQGGKARRAGAAGAGGYGNARGGARGGRFAGRGAGQSSRGQYGRGNAASARGGGQANRRGGGGRFDYGRRGYGYGGDKPSRESSIAVLPEWKMVEEIEFNRLSKLKLDVSSSETDVETITTRGFLHRYDRTYDRINTKAERTITSLPRHRYKVSTTEDPVMKEIASKSTAKVYTTDAILALLMTAPRTLYPWDVIIIREDGKIYIDKRDGGPVDKITVNENANDPPQDTDRDINTPERLSDEAIAVNEDFASMVVSEEPSSRLDMQGPHPFFSAADDDGNPAASCGYLYRKFDLSLDEDDELSLVVRAEVDAAAQGAAGEAPSYVTLRTLLEYQPAKQAAGSAPDWRTKLDTQRGAVLATEMKNNGSKLARWAVETILAGAEQMKVGYVSRVRPNDPDRHSILGIQNFRPLDFARQLNVSLANGWGIVRTIIDLVRDRPDGRYVLLKDPNKPIVRLYETPPEGGVVDGLDVEDDLDGEVPETGSAADSEEYDES